MIRPPWRAGSPRRKPAAIQRLDGACRIMGIWVRSGNPRSLRRGGLRRKRPAPENPDLTVLSQIPAGWHGDADRSFALSK